MRIGAPRWWSVVLIALAVPVLGFWLGQSHVSSRNAEAYQALGVPMATVCEMNEVLDDARVGAFCSSFATNAFLRNLSVATGSLGLLLILSSTLLAAWAGANRDRNARVFPILIPVSLFAIGVLTLMQVATATVGVFSIGFVNLYTIIFVIGGLLAAIGLFRSLRALSKRLSISELAVAVPQADNSYVWRLVNDVASQVGVKPPDNVVVGFQPNFYATAAELRVPGQREALHGETIYLSLPLLRLLYDDELRGVIGHELGHFSGRDVAYTTRFAPMYRALATSRRNLSLLSNHWLQRLARVPAVEYTSFLLSLFAINERRISRDREFEADKVGAQASTPEGLASALMKIGFVAKRWAELRDSVALDSRFEPINNVSDRLAAKARISLAYPSANAAMSMGVEAAAHPTDSHPSTSDRLDALGVKVDALHMRLSDEGWAVHVGAQQELEALEVAVTRLEAAYAQMMRALSEA